MAKWTGESKGNVLGYRIFIFAIKVFGISGGYFILQFVSLYFYLFSADKRRVLDDFYQNYLGFSRSKSHRLIRKNFRLLGKSLIDKIAFLVGKGGNIHYSNSGEKYLRELTENKEGAFLISGHVGNWDIAGNLLKGFDANVSVVMYQNEKEGVQSLLESQGSIPKFKIIGIGNDFSHLIEIYKAIKQGDLVCIHADRFLDGVKTISIPFLGESAKFAIGPFQLIKKLKAPYSFVFAVKESKYGYYFSATKPLIPNKNPEEIARDFVLLLEEKVRAHPEQWFNYYKFHE